MALGLLAVITAGFALSFSAISSVGRASGISPELVWLLPTAIDGAMAVGTVTAVVIRRLGRSTIYPWTVMLANAGFSLLGNALHAYAGPHLALPAVVAMAVSAIPPLNLALSVHLLVELVDVVADVLKGPETLATGPAVLPAGLADAGESSVREALRSKSESSGGWVSCGSVDRACSGGELQRAAWHWALDNRRPDGSLVSGEELARAFARSPRWGRYVKHQGAAGLLDGGPWRPIHQGEGESAEEAARAGAGRVDHRAAYVGTRRF